MEEAKMRVRPLHLFALFIVSGCLFNLYWNLGGVPVAPWDEARHIASAIEMWQGGGLWVTLYQGQPDYWNAKPPLSIWAAAAGYGLFDDKYFGVRFFSTVSSLLVGALIFRWMQVLKGSTYAWLTVALFFTMPSIVVYHGMRAADPDMLFILFVVVAMWSASFATRRSIFFSYVALGFAFLTKSFHVLAYGTVIFFYSVYLLRCGVLVGRDVVLLPLAFVVPVLPWAVARYLSDGARFFEVMFFYDVIKRSTTVIEGHRGGGWFYFRQILSLAVVPLLVAGFLTFRGKSIDFLRGRQGVLLLAWLIVPVLFYSIARSKLEWYIYPVLPVIAMLSVCVVADSLSALGRLGRFVVAGLLVLHLVIGEYRIIREIWSAKPDAMQESLSRISEQQRPDSNLHVYLTDPESGDVWRQDYYAAALLKGNLILRGGGGGAFQKDPSHSVLLDEVGRVIAVK